MKVLRPRTRSGIAVLAIATLMVVTSACGDDDEGGTLPTTSPTATGATVEVRLQEFAVLPSPASVPAGSVTFRATNTGPEDAHELVVIKTDLSITGLPTKNDGSVDEDGSGIEVIEEIEEFPVGQSQTMTVQLTAGAYALICNIVQMEDGKVEAHYKEGMRAPFTVS